jgi:hypothetical protein
VGGDGGSGAGPPAPTRFRTNTIAFGAAMTYDWIVSAIGPFELSEYLGIAVVYGALAITAPFSAAGGPRRWMG